jgi:NAD(P)-dependent dehydrogenase (short-subunit alcohol dehydrogenase family)
MVGRLDGKVRIVTGSGGAIGRPRALPLPGEGERVIGARRAASVLAGTTVEVLAASGEMFSMHLCDLPGSPRCDAFVRSRLMLPCDLDFSGSAPGRPE